MGEANQKGRPWESLGALGGPCGKKTDQKGIPWRSLGVLGDPCGVPVRKIAQKWIPWGSLGLLGGPCGASGRKAEQKGLSWGSMGVLGGPCGIPVRKTDQKGVPWVCLGEWTAYVRGIARGKNFPGISRVFPGSFRVSSPVLDSYPVASAFSSELLGFLIVCYPLVISSCCFLEFLGIHRFFRVYFLGSAVTF